MKFDLKYKIGQIVYLFTYPEQNDRLVTGYIVRDNHILYILACGIVETHHFEMEIAPSKLI